MYFSTAKVLESDQYVIINLKQKAGITILFMKTPSTNVTSVETSLTNHKRSVHEGTKHKCNQCSSQFTVKSSLTEHQKSVHEGMKYPCGSRDYQATQRTHLSKHQKSVHEGRKFPCCLCDYQATERGSLI